MSAIGEAVSRLFGPREKALTIDDVGAIMRAGGYVTQAYSTTIQNPREEIPADFIGMAYGIYRANPIAFRAMVVRMQVFAQARFRFQQIRNGQAGHTFGKTELDILDHPEPTLSTADLLKRASIHADIAGNWFGVRRPDRIKTVRPDYCYLVLGSTARGGELGDVDTEVLGLIHNPGGLYSGNDPESFAVGEYAHYAPIPDPLAAYRGMSWLTSIIREIQNDQLMSVHKGKFLELGATPNIAVKFAPGMTQDKAKEFAELFEQDHTGAYNAYRTIYLAAGADVTVIGSNLQQMDFKAIQGAGETRIAVASGVPAVLLGISEGLQGSSLNAGNYEAAKQSFADIVVRDMWQDMCASLETIVPPPSGSRLWYDEDQIPILRVDVEKAANVINQKATAMRTLWDGGAEPDSVIEAVTSGDLTRLKHTGQPSVQLQETAPAPTGDTPANEPTDGEPSDAQKEAARLRIIEEWSYSPSQPRKSDGKFGTGGGGGGGKSSGGGSGGGGGAGSGGAAPGDGAGTDGDGPAAGHGGKPVSDVKSIENPPAVPKKVWGKGPVVEPEVAYAELHEGKSPNVHPEDVKEIMKLANASESKTEDLTDLQVEGTLLFGGDGLGVKRENMPQFSDVNGNNYLPEYIDHCRKEKGWKVTEGTDVNPASLKPVQSEVSAKKVAGMYNAMKEGKLPGGDIVTSGDDFVIDGHHRWGAGTALSFERPVKITQTRVHATAEEVLKDALEWTDKRGIARQSLTTTANKIKAIDAAVRWYALNHPAPVAVIEAPVSLGFATVLEMAMLEVRCPNGHLLAEEATPPYRFTCSRCKAVVAEAGRWAVTTDPKVVVYSPSQPRRSDGKFGSGGGGGGAAVHEDGPAVVDTPSSFTGQPYDTYHPTRPPGIDVAEAKRRLIAAAPALGEPAPHMPSGWQRIEGLERLHPGIRQQLVEGIEMSSRASDPRLMTNGIRVLDDAGWKEHGGGPEGAFAQGSQIFIKASSHGTPEQLDNYAHALQGSAKSLFPVQYRDGMTQKELPRSAMDSANAAGMSPMHYVAAHETGHIVEMRSYDSPLSEPTRHDADGRFMLNYDSEGKYITRVKKMPPASKYGTASGDDAERWAEGFVHHVAGLDTAPARYVRERLDGLRGRKMRPSEPGKPDVIPLP